ncbi:MAG: sugar transferase [Actinobacteria bacterium]|nr:MAG: sugar transferase [Actinomycetota bacterium]
MNKRFWATTSFFYDAMAVNLAIIVAFYIRFAGKPPEFNFSAYTKLAVFITLVYLVSAYLSSVYTVEDLLNAGYLEPVIKAVTISWLILGAFIWLFQFFEFPRLVFLIGWFFAVVFVYGWRYISIGVLRNKWPKQKILIVGTKPIAKQIISKLREENNLSYKLVGVVSDADNKKYGGAPVIGKTGDIPQLVKEHGIDRLIITDPLRIVTIEQLAEMGLPNLRIEVVPNLYEILVGRVDYNTLTDIPLLELTQSNNKSTYKALKRLTDIVLSVIGLLILFPLVILPSAILIKLTSKGKIFYRQERVGQKSKIFHIVKLRTMYSDAEKKSGPVLAEKKDKRVTPIGRLLRKYRLDELPQLINILEGEMSFIGPRPERPEFVEKYKKKIPGYAARFRLKPGASGLAQISGSYTTDVQNKFRFDLFYLYHSSFWLDIKIILKTIRVMISGTGFH